MIKIMVDIIDELSFNSTIGNSVKSIKLCFLLNDDK